MLYMSYLNSFLVDFFSGDSMDDLFLVVTLLVLEATEGVPQNPLRGYKKTIGNYKVTLTNDNAMVLDLLEEMDAYEVTQRFIIHNKKTRHICVLNLSCYIYEGAVMSLYTFAGFFVDILGDKDKFDLIDGMFAMLENVERIKPEIPKELIVSP